MSDALFAEAVRDHQNGKLDKARAGYEAILRTQPDHAGALSNLAQILRSKGENSAAIELYRQASESPAATGEVFVNLANALRDAGDPQGCETALREAIARAPDLSAAHRKLGRLLAERGAAAEALESFRRALLSAPLDPAVHTDIAELYAQTKAVEFARHHLEMSLSLDPNNWRRWERLARVLNSMGLDEQAARAWRGALQHGASLLDAGTRLANFFWKSGDIDRAIPLMRKIVATHPDRADARANLGVALRQAGHYSAARAQFSAAVELEPDNPAHRVDLASCLVNLGEQEQAHQAFLSLLADEKAADRVRSAYLMALLYSERHSARHKADEHRRLMEPISNQGRGSPRSAPSIARGAPPRIGYLSGSVHGVHPVAQFLGPLIERHAGSGAPSWLYLHQPDLDRTAREISEHCTVRRIHALDDEAVARRIHEDGIDLLVDLSGHTSGNRLGVMAYRPAPASASFIGYPHSTGRSDIDYLIADEIVFPPEDDAIATEEVVRLPRCFLCFKPPDGMSDPQPKEGEPQIIFGSLNHLPKLSPTTLELWAGIIKSVPGSLLLLKCAAFAEEETRRKFVTRFALLGVGEDQLLLEGPEPFERAMRAYDRIDVALDPLPYNGGTTTAHALYLGVPVVTQLGDTFCGRMGASILSAADHPEWVTYTPDAYKAVATSLGEDRLTLAEIKRRLVREIRESALCDIDSYASDVLRLYKEIA